MPKSITDHYGTEITVEPLMGSIGPCVDMERRWTESVYGVGTVEHDSCDRLTPEQALDLADRLREAAEFRG